MIAYAKEEMIAVRSLVKKKWKKGDICMAPFSEDGKYYEAKIRFVDVSDISCEVVFTEYDTKEKVKLADLLSEDDVEWDENADKFLNEIPEAGLEQKNLSEMASKLKTALSGVFSAVPFENPSGSEVFCPPNTLLFDSTVCAEDLETAKKNALVSHFVAGYRTGYYMAISGVRMQSQGMSDAKNSKNLRSEKAS